MHAKGFQVFSFDAPGHGISTEKKTHMLEFVDSIWAIEKTFGSFKIAIGHSLGGMAIFNALTGDFKPKVVMNIGSPASIPNTVGDFCEKIEAGKKVKKGILHYIENNFKVSLERSSGKYLASVYNPLGLIVHDKDDVDVPVKNAYELYENWPNAHLIITEGLGHRKVLMDDAIIDEIDAFLNKVHLV